MHTCVKSYTFFGIFGVFMNYIFKVTFISFVARIKGLKSLCTKRLMMSQRTEIFIRSYQLARSLFQTLEDITEIAGLRNILDFRINDVQSEYFR